MTAFEQRVPRPRLLLPEICGPNPFVSDEDLCLITAVQCYGSVTIELNFVDPSPGRIESTSTACIGATKPGTGAMGIFPGTSETSNG
jgi:hypothetical protein